MIILSVLLFVILYFIINKVFNYLDNQKIKLSLTKRAKDYIVDNGFDANYGARPLKRYLSKNLETLLAKKLIDGTIATNSNLIVDVSNNELVIETA